MKASVVTKKKRLEKLILVQVVNKLPAFNGTRKLITVFERP